MVPPAEMANGVTRRSFLATAAGVSAAVILWPSSASAQTSAEVAVQAARTQLGLPYITRGISPGVGFDCSGLTKWAWQQAGVAMDHYTVSQAASFAEVPLDQAQLGDLVFSATLSHVVIYTGLGTCISAPSPGKKIREGQMYNSALCVRPTLAPVRQVPSAAASGWQTQTVRVGDSMYGIANKRAVNLLTLARLNNVSPSAILMAGDVVVLPFRSSPTPPPPPPPASVTQTPPAAPAPAPVSPIAPPSAPSTGATTKTYVVESGDTLSRIASRNATTVDQLVQLNNITNANRIQVGQTLKLP